MAINIRRGENDRPITRVALKVSVPTSNTTTGVPASGTACLAGTIPGVAADGIDVNSGLTTLETQCWAELPVNGKTVGGGNGAINLYDVLYMQTDGTLDKNSSGSGAVRFGIGVGAKVNTTTGAQDRTTNQLVASGATATVIMVWVGK